MFNLKALKDKVVGFFKQKVKEVIKKSTPKIKRNIHERFRAYLENEDFYRSLREGRLQSELGLPQGQSYQMVDELVDLIIDKLDVIYIDDDDGGKIIIDISEESIEEIASSVGSIESENGFDVPWAEWLLLYGSKVIITDHRFKYEPGLGRSEGGIMVKRGTWEVPGEYAGTAQNNVITRALSNFAEELASEITVEINRKL